METVINQKIHTVLSGLFVLFLAGLFPLIFHDHYLDIQTCKAQVFRAAAILYLIMEGMLSCMTFSPHSGKSRKHEREKENRKDGMKPAFLRFPYLYFLLLFLGAVIISMCFSKWPEFAFNGNMGRNVGTFDYWLGGATCIVLTYRFRPWKNLGECIVILNVLEFLLIILNFWGLDPLGMYADLIPEQHSYFLGTVGNINATSTWLCVITAGYLAAFVVSGSHRKRAVFGSMAFISLYCGFAASSDSYLIGCAAAYAAVFVFLILFGAGIRKLSVCFLFFWGAAVLMRLSLELSHRYSISSSFLEQYEKNELLMAVLSTPSLTVLLVLGLLIWVLMILSESRFRNRTITVLIITGIMIAAAAILLTRLNPSIMESLFLKQENGGKTGFFLLSDEFGSGRGYIWKKSVEMWKTYTLREKLFGCGTDCFYLQMIPVYGEEMTVMFGAPFADAHCELLQMLLTTGLTGVIGWFGFLAGAFMACWKHTGKHPMLLAGAAVLGSYLAQGIVNNPVPSCLPVLFTAVGTAGANLLLAVDNDRIRNNREIHE